MQTDGGNGDICHHEVFPAQNVSRGALRRMLRACIETWQLGDLLICAKSGVRPVLETDIPP